MDWSSVDGRLRRQIEFIREIDKVKHILRRNYLCDASRRENDAEHSWHIALMAPLLAEYAPVDLNILKVVKILLVHDLVEIDAGDTFIYDTEGLESQREREEAAAERIFGLLPEDQTVEYRSLWEEYEDQKTDEAAFARVMDRLHPLLLNWSSGGTSWQENGVPEEKVRELNQTLMELNPRFAPLVQAILDDCRERKLFCKKD